MQMLAIAAENTKTVENLLAAFEGESNANAKYTAFALKADTESWHGAASLFRAAARAEQIHASNHARVIKQLGGEVTCKIYAVDMKTTLDNFKTALAGEQYEFETMYPAFIAEAETHKNTIAILTLDWAMETEKTHARLYTETIDLVNSGNKSSWAGSARTFYVCAACGYTSENPKEHDRCPVCKLGWDKFEAIR
jgi:rubrerythrin